MSEVDTGGVTFRPFDLKTLAKPRPALTDGTEVDPVVAGVVRSAMETICFEMAV